MDRCLVSPGQGCSLWLNLHSSRGQLVTKLLFLRLECSSWIQSYHIRPLRDLETDRRSSVLSTHHPSIIPGHRPRLANHQLYRSSPPGTPAPFRTRETHLPALSVSLADQPHVL